MKKILLSLALALSLLFGFALGEVWVEDGVAVTDELLVEYGQWYSETDEVALYLHAFQELPENFITKQEARSLGWDSGDGNLWDVAYGYSIGGDKFGNREGLLPEKRGRQYYECDVNYGGGYRGGERIVYSDDGLIYYTGDHYESFDLIYDGWYDGEIDYGSYDSYDSYEGSGEFGSLIGDLLYSLLG